MRIVNPFKNFELCLLDWAVIEPYWRRNDVHPLDPDRLVRAFHHSWFKTDDRGERVFVAGAVTFDARREMVVFVNGRHRTNLLLLYSSVVPVAVNTSILDHPLLGTAVLHRSSSWLEAELPRLPTLRFKEMHVLPHRFPCGAGMI